jgi:branched-chain amino acid transport system ATP-binding protein
MLQLSGAAAGYKSGRHVVHDLDIEVRPGRLVTLIGANGVGKSTTMRAAVGQLRLEIGTRHLDGEDVTKFSPAAMLRAGVALVPEGRGILSSLSVAENISLGGFTLKSKSERDLEFTRVVDLFPRLGERLDVSAGLLSGGEQQMLAIGRALMSRPRYLLLDEPSMGLAPRIVDQLADLFCDLRDSSGLGILLVEQNAAMALAIADEAHVMEHGTITHSGEPSEMNSDDRVRRAYLGS